MLEFAGHQLDRIRARLSFSVPCVRRAGRGACGSVAVEHDQQAGKERLILLAIEDVAGQ
jgi:hypothetical protein